MPIDPTTLAALSITFIASQIAAGGLEEIGKDIYSAVKGSFGPRDLIALDLLEKYPTNTDILNENSTLLEEKLMLDDDLIAKLDSLVEKIPDVQIKKNKIVQKGDGNIAAQDITNSTININK